MIEAETEIEKDRETETAKRKSKAATTEQKIEPRVKCTWRQRGRGVVTHTIGHDKAVGVHEEPRLRHARRGLRALSPRRTGTAQPGTRESTGKATPKGTPYLYKNMSPLVSKKNTQKNKVIVYETT